MKSYTPVLLLALALVSQSVFAGTCPTYYETKNLNEISAKEITPLGRAIENRKHEDKIYLACTEMKDGQCARISLVLEATSCATKEAPRFFDLNKNLNFVRDNVITPKDRMSDRTDIELGLPKSPADYLFFTWMTLYIASGFMDNGDPLFYVLIPVGVVADIVAAPIRGTTYVAHKITKNVVMKKIGKLLAIDPTGAKMSPMKMKNVHFENLIIAMDEAAILL